MVNEIFDTEIRNDQKFKVTVDTGFRLNERESGQVNYAATYDKRIKHFSFAYKEYFDNPDFSPEQKINFIKDALAEDKSVFGGIHAYNIRFFSISDIAKDLIESYLVKLSADTNSDFYFVNKYKLLAFRAINLLPGAADLISDYFENRPVNQHFPFDEMLLIYALAETGRLEDAFVNFETLLNGYYAGEKIDLNASFEYEGRFRIQYFHLLCLSSNPQVSDYFYDALLKLSYNNSALFQYNHQLIRFINESQYEVLRNHWQGDFIPSNIFATKAEIENHFDEFNNRAGALFIDKNALSEVQYFIYSCISRWEFNEYMTKLYIKHSFGDFRFYSIAHYIPNHFVHNFYSTFGCCLKKAGLSDITVQQEQLEEPAGMEVYRVRVISSETCYYFTYKLSDYDFGHGEDQAYWDHYSLLAKAINLCLIKKRVAERFIEINFENFGGDFIWGQPAIVQPVLKEFRIPGRAVEYADEFHAGIIEDCQQ